MQINDNDALIAVDVQNDFCPRGALGVEGGDKVVPIINQLVHRFDRVVFTRDWHPSNHCSFDDNPQMQDESWPPHCVADTPGAEFHGDLHVPVDAVIISKGTDPDREEYSSFGAADLEGILRNWGTTRVFIAGLATDYCVLNTVLDSLKAGFDTYVVENAIRGVDVPQGSVEQAIARMKEAGAQFIWSGDLHE